MVVVYVIGIDDNVFVWEVFNSGIYSICKMFDI